MLITIQCLITGKCYEVFIIRMLPVTDSDGRQPVFRHSILDCLHGIRGICFSILKEIGKAMEEVIKEMEEINRLLKERSKELDRRARFDEEISKEIQSILNKRRKDEESD